MATRKALIAGNWKMYKTARDGCQLAEAVARGCGQVDQRGDRQVLLCPPATILAAVAASVSGSTILVGAQNVCWAGEGAFTGEISPTMVRDAGGQAAIVGHSERRQLFFENDELINQRLRGGLAHGLLMLLCIGETLAEREEGRTFPILEGQLRQALAGVTTEEMARVVVAYEPVWAIGTGKTASKEQAQDAHAFVRGVVAEIFEKSVAAQTRILYGGSVKPGNVDELMAQEDIDGALVGGAALDPEAFIRIVNFR